MYEGYLSFGGNEVVNNDRARGYAETADCPMFWFKGEWCPGVRPLVEGVDAGYDYADIQSAPWYDAALPELSTRFYGSFGLTFKSFVDSTRTASVVQGIDDGGVIGRTRKAVHEVRVKTLLAAKGADALDYGMGWLSAALDPGACGQHGTECGTADLAFLADCPGTPNDYTKTLYNITESRRNLAKNPAGDELPGGWETNGLFDLTQIEGWGQASAAVRGTRNATGAARIGAYIDGMLASTAYTVSFSVALSVPMDITVSLRPNITSGTGMVSVVYPAMPAGVHDLVIPFTTTATAPTGTAGLAITTGSGTAGATIDIAALLITKNAPTAEGDWVETRRNTILNPEQTSGGTSSGAEMKGRFGWGQTATTGITDHPAGLTTARRTTQGSATAQDSSSRGIDWYGNTQQGSPSTSGNWMDQPVTTGVPFTVSFWVRYSRAMTVRPYISIRQHDGAGKWVGAAVNISTPQNFPSGGTEWMRVWGTYTPTSAVAKNIVVLNGISSGEMLEQGFWMEQTGLMIEHGVTTPGEFFSGNTVSPDALVRYQWADPAKPNGVPSIQQTAPVPVPGPFFTGDYPVDGELSYSWAGTQHLSASIETSTIPYQVLDPEAYDRAMRGVARFLHGVGAISGPLVVNEYAAGEFNAYEVEFTLDAETPWVFSAMRELALTPSLPTTVQDTPYNLVPYPSAELAGANVVVATNLSPNPSVETDATGWTSTAQGGTAPGAMFTSGRSTELAAVGGASQRARILGNSGTTVVTNSQTTMITQQDVPLGSYTAGTRFSISVWQAVLIAAGASGSVIRGTRVSVDWRSATASLRVDSVGTGTAEDFGGHAFTVSGVLPPAGATIGRVLVYADVTWSSSATAANNSDIRQFVDALMVSIP